MYSYSRTKRIGRKATRSPFMNCRHRGSLHFVLTSAIAGVASGRWYRMSNNCSSNKNRFRMHCSVSAKFHYLKCSPSSVPRKTGTTGISWSIRLGCIGIFRKRSIKPPCPPKGGSWSHQNLRSHSKDRSLKSPLRGDLGRPGLPAFTPKVSLIK